MEPKAASATIDATDAALQGTGRAEATDVPFCY